MENKELFLTLEDRTVRVIDGLDAKKLHNVIPDQWIEILSLESTEAKCQAVIELWTKYLVDRLPNVIAIFNECLENVELLERFVEGEKRYSLLYSVRDEDGKCIYYEGRNPQDNTSYREELDFWNEMPSSIRDFYEEIHDGFYHYMNRGMGLQPLQFTHFMEPEPDGLEWNLNYDGNEDVLDEDSHTMAFFWNNLGLAVSVDDKDGSEDNAVIWRKDAPCEFHASFWNIVDQLLLYF